MEATGWIALLRGINVGGHNMVPMTELRRLFEDTGCTSVSSYIQSGNVLFRRPAASDRDALAAELHDAVLHTFGVRSSIVLRTFAELRGVAAAHPFGTDTSQTFVTFLAREPAAGELRRLAEVSHAPDRYVIAGPDLYLHLPNGVRGARLTGAVLERNLGMPGTSRNWKTVTRLADLADAVAA